MWPNVAATSAERTMCHCRADLVRRVARLEPPGPRPDAITLETDEKSAKGAVVVDDPAAEPNGELPGALSPALRSKVVALAAQGVGRMPVNQVPAPLRRAASFTPAKRLRLAGNQIFAALDDPDFRSHLAVQVKASVPKVAAALEAGPPFEHADLPDIAALAYIQRPPGWTEVVLSADDSSSDSAGEAVADLSATVARLSDQLDQARGETKRVRERMRGQLESLKADNTQLRRTLGETRGSLRTAESAAAAADELVNQARRESDVAQRELEAETRRLRAKVGALEADLAASRRSARGGREAETARLRLLLDTLVGALDGLRRELALPTSESLPADNIDAVDPASPHPARVGLSLPGDDPTLLRELLDLPRLHLIVDGYNVSKTAWGSATLEQQRQRLLTSIAGLVAGRRVETTVAFDGAELARPPAVTAPRGVRVLFSQPGVIADDLIRDLVRAEPKGRPIVVVTTDRELAESVIRVGARTVASAALVRLIGADRA